MGKQQGALKLRGTHGDFTFAQTKDGFIWKEKAKRDPNLINKDSMVRVKRNRDEFMKAGKAVSLIREGFLNQMKIAKDRSLTGRLTTVMLAAIKADTVSPTSDRKAMFADLSMLELFQCNPKALFGAILGTDYETNIDRVTGEVNFSIPSFNPKQCLSTPVGATHFRIIAACGEFDFNMQLQNCQNVTSVLFPIDNLPTALISLTNTLNPGTVLPIIVAAGIQFTELGNLGEHTYLTGGDHCSLCFVKTDKV